MRGGNDEEVGEGRNDGEEEEGTMRMRRRVK